MKKIILASIVFAALTIPAFAQNSFNSPLVPSVSGIQDKLTQLQNQISGKADASAVASGLAAKADEAAIQTINQNLTYKANAYYGSTLMQKPTSYRNVVNVTGGQIVLYLTTDGTANGPPIFKDDAARRPTVIPIVNDATKNYLYGWTFSNGGKTLTINVNLFGVSLGIINLTGGANGVPVNVVVTGEGA